MAYRTSSSNVGRHSFPVPPIPAQTRQLQNRIEGPGSTVGGLERFKGRFGVVNRITPGTAFVVLTLVGASALFNVYIQHFSSYPRVYGAIGGFIILMLWIYIASLIVLVGAVTDREIETSADKASAA